MVCPCTFAEAWKNGIFPEQNPHAPLYYGLLWLWIQFAGKSAFATRWLSLIAGVASVAALWTCVKGATRSTHTANIAALLMALSPFAIWYAQEARMYSQYLLFATLALIALWRLLIRRVTTGAMAAYILFATAMAYTHFFGVFTLVAQAIAALIVFVFQRSRSNRRVDGARLTVMFGAVAVICTPIPLALLGSGRTFDTTDVTRHFVGLAEMTELVTTEFLLRLPLFTGLVRYLYVLPVAVIFGFGVRSILRKDKSSGGLFSLLAVGPMIAFLPASLAVPIFTPKYLISIYPVLVEGLALGIVTLSHFRRSVGLCSLAGLIALGAVAYYRDLTDPNVQREQWSFVSLYLTQHADPSDKIVVFADYLKPVLEWHYPGPATVIKFEADPLHPEAFFDSVEKGSYRHLWLVLAHDRAAKADHRLIEVAAARYPWLRAEYPNQGFIRVLEYGLRNRYDALPEDVTPTKVEFNNGIRLVGFRMEEQQAIATDRISHPPSHWIHVVAYWQREPDLSPEHVRPYLKLVSADGGEWGGDLARIPTVFELDPPKNWPSAAGSMASIIESHHDINLNPVTPAGQYKILIGLVREDGIRIGQRENPSVTGAVIAPFSITSH